MTKLTAILAALTFAAGCGAHDENKRAHASGAPTLTVTGTLAKAQETAVRVHTIHSTYVGTDPASIAVRMRLVDGGGHEVWTRTQPGAEADWRVVIDGGEGRYTLAADASVPGGAVSASWSIDIVLDQTPPAVTATAELAPTDEHGSRALSVRVKVAAERSLHCDASLDGDDFATRRAKASAVPGAQTGRRFWCNESPQALEAFRFEVARADRRDAFAARTRCATIERRLPNELAAHER